MFNKMLSTREVAEEISKDILFLCWSMIQVEKKKLKTEEIDYLQVINLEAVEVEGRICQRITITSEVPEYKDSVV